MPVHEQTEANNHNLIALLHRETDILNINKFELPM